MLPHSGREIRFGQTMTARSEILDTAISAARRAGEVLCQRYNQPHHVRHKGAIDLVTEADLASEEVVIDVLRRRHPSHAVLAEESASSLRPPVDGPVWIVDPLDGTTNFSHGFPWFCVSIAFWDRGEAQVGVIYCPRQEELFWAALGQGAWLNGDRIRVSQVDELPNALLAMGFPYDVQENPVQVVAALQAVLVRVQGVRRAGAAAMDLAYVACGRLDGFWEIKLKPWDTAAGQLLVQEAGGPLSNFKGQAYSPFMPEILATNGRIHRDLLEILGQYRQVRD